MKARDALRDALRLGLVCAGAVALLAGVHALTRERIEARSGQAERDALAVVLPAAFHDNDLAGDAIELHAPRWLGSEAPLRAWRARRGGTPSAIVVEAVAPDGYAGPIRLLVGVLADGRLSGVRVTAHRETPGLGDPVDAAKSPWIDGLRGRGLGNPPVAGWTVRRDGGEFDQFAGATMTPRATLHAVRHVLQYLRRHGAEIHAAAPGATLEHADGPA